MHRVRRALVAAAVAATLATGAPVAAAAQPSPEPSAQVPRPTDILHGEGTVQTKQGKVRVAVQQGTASQASDTSLTVKSPDGFTRTWAVSASTKIVSARTGMEAGRLGSGAKVFVWGTVQGTDASASYSAGYILVHSGQHGSTGTPAEPSAPSTTG
jgi:hypothetical protein